MKALPFNEPGALFLIQQQSVPTGNAGRDAFGFVYSMEII